MWFAITLVFAACYAVEKCKPDRVLPATRAWHKRLAAVALCELAVTLASSWLWHRYMPNASWLGLSDHLGTVGAGALAYFIATFVFYWWHRARHESDALWRIFHQLHHSPARIELITTFYKHPLEVGTNLLLGNLLVYPVLGLRAESATLYFSLIVTAQFFVHLNIATPRCIGYVFQRPEMHRIHHQRGRHKSNYGDIVWWDMLFGTYENPAECIAPCGFDDGKEQQLMAMLKYQDIHK